MTTVNPLTNLIKTFPIIEEVDSWASLGRTGSDWGRRLRWASFKEQVLEWREKAKELDDMRYEKAKRGAQWIDGVRLAQLLGKAEKWDRYVGTTTLQEHIDLKNRLEAVKKLLNFEIIATNAYPKLIKKLRATMKEGSDE